MEIQRNNGETQEEDSPTQVSVQFEKPHKSGWRVGLLAVTDTCLLSRLMSWPGVQNRKSSCDGQRLKTVQVHMPLGLPCVISATLSGPVAVMTVSRQVFT